MPKHDVFVYMTYFAKIPNVEAENQIAAIEKAVADFDPDKHLKILPTSGSPAVYAEYADELTGALVDEVGDEDHLESCAYELKDGEWVLEIDCHLSCD